MTGNRLKQNNDKTEDLVVVSRRRVSVSQDRHLRVGSRGISFKSHVKSLGVYIDATLSTAKHIDHIRLSAYLEIRRISSVRHLLLRKATVQLMCSFVLLTIATLYSLTSLLIKCTAFKKFKNHAAKVVFRKSKHEHVTPLLKKRHWIPVKERILFKIATFAFRFFDGTLPPYLSSCLSVYTLFRTLRSSSAEKKQQLFCVKRKLKGFGGSLFRRPLSGTVFLPTSDTAAPSHSSKLPLRHSSSILPSPSYLESLENLRFFPPL